MFPVRYELGLIPQKTVILLDEVSTIAGNGCIEHFPL
jgi:hypothetical protein